MNEFELRRKLRDLRREREPNRDLWAGIAARLAEHEAPTATRSTRSRWVWLGPAMAASLALCGLLGWQLGPLQHGLSTLGPPKTAGSQLPLSRNAEGLALEYRAALSSLPAVAVPAELQATADVLDESAEQLRIALRQQPNSTFLLEQLRRVYALRLQLSRPTWLS